MTLGSLVGCEFLPQPVDQPARDGPAATYGLADAPPPVDITPPNYPVDDPSLLPPPPPPHRPKPMGLSGITPTCDGAPVAAQPRPIAADDDQVQTRLKGAVVMVGMDALEATLIDRMVDRGELPHFAQIGQQGFRSTVDISHPIVSPSVWTTLASGYRSNVHGIPHWTAEDGTPLRSMDVKVNRLWDVATANEKTTWVINWLLTIPVSSIHGVMTSEEFVYVGGIDEPGDSPPNRDAGVTTKMLVWPESFCATAAQQVPPIDWVKTTPLSYQFDHYSALRHPLIRDESTVRFFEELVGTGTPDLVMLYMSGADALSHRLWPFTDDVAVGQMAADSTLWQRSNDALAEREYSGRPRLFSDGPTTPDMLQHGRTIVEDYYRYLDTALGRIMAKIDPDHSTLLVVSDHGFKTASAPVPLYPAHSGYGVFMGWGHRVKPGRQATAVFEDVDVAPTVYALVGLPIANDMPGRVVTERFAVAAPRKVASHRGVSALTVTGRPQNFQRFPELRALGYVDDEGKPLKTPVQ